MIEANTHMLICGAPGTGKTQYLLDYARETATSHADAHDGPIVLLAPDRRRADRLEALLGTETIGKLRLPGGHRIARSVNSYAYLIIAQWMIERRDPAERPNLVTGAEEDLWVKEWLDNNQKLWTGILPEPALDSEWFRMDLRNLFARLGELGLSGTDLCELSELAGEPVWKAAAEAYSAYGGKDPFGAASERIDSARIQRIAATILTNWNQLAEKEGVLTKPPVPKHILIDDLQDCTNATLALLEALAATGARIVATTCPDVATSAFRGGQHDLGRYLERALDCHVVTLDEQYRLSPQVEQIFQTIVYWLDGGNKPEPIVAPQSVAVTTSNGRRGAFLADRIRRYYFMDGIDWKDQAVIVRNSGDIDEIRRLLQKAAIPVARSNRAARFAQIPLSAILLKLLCSTGDGNDTENLGLELLTSPLVGVDELLLFRLLRAGEIETDPESLRQLLDDPTQVPEELRVGPTWEKLQLAATLWATKNDASKESAQRGIWDLWEAADKTEEWRDLALRGGRGGERADDNLDTILALLRRADLWQQENPLGATARAFAKEQLKEDIATDSIANVGIRSPGVEILTVAEAAGREWDVVYVCGLQDGTWPAMIQPGTLLATSRLSNITDALLASEWQPNTSVSEQLFSDPALLRSDVDISDTARQRRHSEARLLAAAVSRSRKHLHLVVINDQDQAPSQFVAGLVRAGALAPLTDMQGALIISDPKRPFDLSGVIGELRYGAIDPSQSSENRHEATRALAVLAVKGVSGADPKQWIGAEGLTSNQIVGVDKPRLSPSGIQSARDCILLWFFRNIKADNQMSPFEAATLGPLEEGNLIHALAERLPYGTPSQLHAAFEELWDELGVDEQTHWVKLQKQKLEDMVSNLAEHFQCHPKEVITEEPFLLEVDDAIVSGRIDRIEINGDDTATIVDIKTGKTGLSKSEVENNAQLSAYQLAMRKRFTIRGAGLLAVGVGATSRTPLLRPQAAFDDTEAQSFTEELNELGRAARGPEFMPTISNSCRTCPFISICPAYDNSLRTIE